MLAAVRSVPVVCEMKKLARPPWPRREWSEEDVRRLQYARWTWATRPENFTTLVNLCRAAGHVDGRIAAALERRCPLSFGSSVQFERFCRGIRDLRAKLHREMGWRRVRFVLTGSAVPCFSQNPCKGAMCQPTKICSASSSDTDLVIQTDDWTPPANARYFPTTCSPSTTSRRWPLPRPKEDGDVISQQLNGVIRPFAVAWARDLPGGLQLTLGSVTDPIPPWEMYI